VHLHAQDLAEALQLAREECRALGHPFLGTEHLLLGLVREPSGEGGAFLRRRGFGIGRLRRSVRQRVGRGERAAACAEPPFSLRALGVVRLAENLAAGFGEAANTVHLLWALLQDRDSDATQILMNAGADPAAWAAALEERLSEPTRRRPLVFTSAAGERPSAQVAESHRWRERLLKAPQYLKERVVGQDAAIDRVVSALGRSWAGLLGAGRPLASFLFAGPRGAGKSTLAQHLAEFLYGQVDRFIRLNMDEFSDEQRAPRLVGTPNGTPAEQEGVLTRLALEYPYSLLFLEDADRAHPRALEALAQILQRGHVYDGRGQRVDFRDHVLVLSVNVDPDFFERESPVGFRLTSRDLILSQERLERDLLPELERTFLTECVELVDEVVFFPPLGQHEMLELLETWTREMTRGLAQRRDVKVQVAPEVLALLAGKAEELGHGAGILRRLFIREVENRLAQAMLEGRFHEGDTVEVKAVGDRIEIQVSRPLPEGAQPPRPRGRRDGRLAARQDG
jgi:ATP-dependent Clp protease ATP-binding subunit ClpA